MVMRSEMNRRLDEQPNPWIATGWALVWSGAVAMRATEVFRELGKEIPDGEGH